VAEELVSKLGVDIVAVVVDAGGGEVAVVAVSAACLATGVKDPLRWAGQHRPVAILP
jgi:hypothetical protein